MITVSRRRFLAAAAAARAAAQTLPGPLRPARAPRVTPPVCIHSQVLVKIEYADLGPILGGLGVDACDLTVQEGGHVRPDRASLDLVRAIESIRGAGSDVLMISTAATTIEDPNTREVAAIAGLMQVPVFRPGHWKWGSGDIMTRLSEVRRDWMGLAALARQAGTTVAFHNQAGDWVGASVWDADAMLRGMDPQAAGYDFDTGFAVAEGGVEGWATALRLVQPRLKAVAARDFYWAKTGDKWAMTPCPLGEGMVDWERVFTMLARANFKGPISIQADYRPANEPAAIQKDAEFLKRRIAAAYRTPA